MQMELIELKKILHEIYYNSANRSKFIKLYQDQIWNDVLIEDEELNETLTAAAYDLDFYEPDDKLRRESSSYYGDEKLLNILNSLNKKIEGFEKRLRQKSQ